MTTPVIVPSEIEHLDFEAQEETRPACAGYSINPDSSAPAPVHFCAKEPKLIAIYACCGDAQHYCLECYNTILAAVSGFHVRGRAFHIAGSTALGIGPQHSMIKDNTFSQIHFL